jgi:ferredoxin, 2Fe-2S
MYNITYQFEQKGLAPITIANVPEGQSLLETALMNDIELHHNCGGVCACSTCHLYVEQGEAALEELTDREEDFIDRAVNPRRLVRAILWLHCQIKPNFWVNNSPFFGGCTSSSANIKTGLIFINLFCYTHQVSSNQYINL